MHRMVCMWSGQFRKCFKWLLLYRHVFNLMTGKCSVYKAQVEISPNCLTRGEAIHIATGDFSSNVPTFLRLYISPNANYHAITLARHTTVPFVKIKIKSKIPNSATPKFFTNFYKNN